MGKSNKRHYWLGSDTVNKQDAFFLEALDSKLWSAGTKEQWDACWHIQMPKRATFKQLDASKTINHIPGNNALTIKSNLHKTLTKAKKRVAGLPQEQRYSFYPDTYSMPEDYFRFQEVAAKNPDWLWIQKPKNLSRGRGIEVVQHPETVPMDNEWIIQRYLSEPHLWNGYKYVLRCYVLITSAEPLRFYWYHEGFAKQTSEPYSNDDLGNLYRHLTNPDVNEHNEDVDVPVIFHSFKHYREWLRSEGADDEKLFAELQDLIALTVIAARESFRSQSQSVGADTQGAYELIGLDCMVDSDLKPWILECNLSPSLDACSTSEDKAQVETEIKSQLVKDIVSILGLNETEAPINLNEQQKAAYELERAGGFQCVFPTENANDYLNCFPVPRYADVASLPEGTDVDYSKIPLKAQEGVEAVFEDSLALLYGINSKDEQQFIFPNELATLIWLQNSEGSSPQEIADELSEVYGDDNQQGRLKEIWDVLADWSQANLFVSDEASEASSATLTQEPDWSSTMKFELAGVGLNIRSACPFAGSYVESFFKAYKTDKSLDAITVDILRSRYGYVITSGTSVIAGSQKLSTLIPKVLELIARRCLSDNDIAVVEGLVASIGGKNMLFVSDSPKIDTWVYEFVAAHSETRILSGPPILRDEPRCIRSTNFPLYLSPSGKGRVEAGVTIAEKDGEAYQLQTQNIEIDQAITIDYLIFVQSLKKGHQMESEEPIQGLRNADVLAKVWQNCVHKKSQAATALPAWLEGVQGIKINLFDEEGVQKELASLLKLLMS